MNVVPQYPTSVGQSLSKSCLQEIVRYPVGRIPTVDYLFKIILYLQNAFRDYPGPFKISVMGDDTAIERESLRFTAITRAP